MKIPFFLITGFLGSGKTTFLKNFLENYNSKYKIGIIQNEYALINIDSIELKSINAEFNILEVNNGSAFCVCNIAKFIPSLIRFIESYSPELIIMECSGLTDPTNILDLINNEKISNKIFISNILCIVNPCNIMKLLNVNIRVRNQIIMADEIIINKIDLVTERDYLNKITQNIKDLNPHATIHYSSYCNLKSELKIFYDENRLLKSNDLETQNKRPEIEVKVLKTQKIIDINKLHTFVRDNKEKLLRIKGVLKNNNSWLNVQFDGVEFKKNIINYSLDQNTLLIFIGEKISEIDFKVLFNNENN